MKINKRLLKCFGLAFFLPFSNAYLCLSQYQPPFKVANSDSESQDSLWVLFSDIRSSTEKIIVSTNSISQPLQLKAGELVTIDSNYKLEMVIMEVKQHDSLRCSFSGRLINRQNSILNLRGYFFDGVWNIEGSTDCSVVPSCDFLIISPWNRYSIIISADGICTSCELK